MTLDLTGVNLIKLIENECFVKFKDNKCRCPFLQAYKSISFEEAVKELGLSDQLKRKNQKKLDKFEKLKNWDFKKSEDFPEVQYNEKLDAYVPVKDSYRNIRFFFHKAGLNIIREEVTDDLVISCQRYGYIVENELNAHLVAEEMRKAGCIVKPATLMEIFNVMKYEKRQNSFQEIVKANRNKKYHLIDDLIDCLRLRTNLEKDLFRKFLFNFVNQGFNQIIDGQPQFICQGMLVIQGEQGIGKSTFVEQIGLCDTKNIFHRSVEGLDLDDAHNMLAHTRRNIVELNEMIISTKKEYNAMKAFLTQGKDDYRPLYKNERVHKPRFTVFVSTTNDTKFLKDHTGSRRFWVIHPQANPETGYIDNPKTKNIDMKQVLGAIYDLLVDKTIDERIALCSLTKQQKEQCNQSNRHHYDGGNIEAVFEDLFDIRSNEKNFFCTKKELFALLAVHKIEMKDDYQRVKNFLQANGVEFDKNGYEKCYKVNGSVVRGYKLWNKKKCR